MIKTLLTFLGFVLGIVVIMSAGIIGGRFLIEQTGIQIVKTSPECDAAEGIYFSGRCFKEEINLTGEGE